MEEELILQVLRRLQTLLVHGIRTKYDKVHERRINSIKFTEDEPPKHFSMVDESTDQVCRRRSKSTKFMENGQKSKTFIENEPIK